jgi:iron complex transport system substrate-binding protein
VVAVAKAAGAARPSVILAQYSAKDGQTAFTVPPAGWIQTYMTEAAGGTAAWKDAGPGDGWKKIGIEQLSAWNPSYTFIVSYQVPAVRVAEEVRAAGFLKGTIAGFPSDFHSWDQADSRWILGLEWLAVRLHPDLFPALDMRKETLAFYTQLYGIDEATVARIVMPRVESALAGK